jgi:hypothetical protein
VKELMRIQSKLSVPKLQFNKFGNYKYRNLDDINEAVKPILRELNCCLTLSDDIVLAGDRFYVKATATLKNEAGEEVVVTAFARESFDKKGMDSAQITGAASSYARKYALNGLFAIDDTKDADSFDNSAEVKIWKSCAERNRTIKAMVQCFLDQDVDSALEVRNEMTDQQVKDLAGEMDNNFYEGVYGGDIIKFFKEIKG